MRYFKATRPDGTDFCTGTIDCQAAIRARPGGGAAGMTQQTLWHEHEPVVSKMRDGSTIRACRTCGARL